MRRRGWLAAMAVVLLANAVALTLVAVNRGGEPDAVVVLTDRELPLARRAADDSGVSLRLDGTDLLDTHDWLDAEKMGQLGFDPAVIGDRVGATTPHWKLSARQAFVVLEYQDQPTEGSRIAAIDAGRDAAALRRRYADRQRQIVVPALIGIKGVIGPQDEEGRYTVEAYVGRIQRILVARIHVPRRFHAALGPVLDDEPQRYRVTVAFGRRHEPWILAAEVP